MLCCAVEDKAARGVLWLLSLKELNLYFKIMNVKLCLLNQEMWVLYVGDLVVGALKIPLLLPPIVPPPPPLWRWIKVIEVRYWVGGGC